MDEKDSWEARKVREATTPLTEAESARLRPLDALRESFRVSAAGVDVTRWVPQLPPELRKPQK